MAPSLPAARPGRHGVVGFIGAGNYGARLLDAFAAAGASLHTVVSANGVAAAHYGRKLGSRHAASEAGAVLGEAEIDTVCIATRHDSHAALVGGAIKAGKHVFVEKPLALTSAELAAIKAELRAAPAPAPMIMVGFNRRFAPMVVKAKSLLGSVGEPKSLVMTVNAGAVPRDHWTQDAHIGGGRILGEACHFIDLIRHLAGAPVSNFNVVSMLPPQGLPDTATITLRFMDGSIGVINYFANGHRSVPKERLEVYCAGRILVLDNYRRLTAHGWPAGSGMRAWRQDKGQAACVAAFLAAVRSGGPAPIPWDEIVEVSELAIETAARA